jgi:hypothetical protein
MNWYISLPREQVQRFVLSFGHFGVLVSSKN